MGVPRERVRLVASDPSWPEQAWREIERLLSALPGAFVAIEHFGSTAVPDLPAKPIIDLLAGLEQLGDGDALIAPLQALDYAFKGSFTARLMFVRRDATAERTHQLHLVEYGAPGWTGRLAFRDALRSDPDLRARYLAEKRRLAAAHPHDFDAYASAKQPFLQREAARLATADR